MKQRILVLNYEFPPLGGGASPGSYQIARRYAAHGHEVHVVTMGFKGLPAEETMGGIRVTRVPSLRKKKELCTTPEMASYVFSAIRYLRKHLREGSYDVCHVHFFIPTGIVALWAKRKFGLPYVVTPHGSDVPGYNEDRFTFQHHFTKPIIRAVAEGAAAITSPSLYLKELMEKNVGVYADKTTVVKNGIDVNDITPGVKKNIILATGRLLPRKGFQYLIAAVADKDIGYEVHICGDGPMRQRLDEQARTSRTKVVMHGWLNNTSAAYRDLLRSAAIYCLPSSRENASISLLEAMSAGCVMITTDVSGCPETVGSAGILVPPENSDAIREALTSLISDPARLKVLQQRARERAVREYDWEDIVTQYEAVLTKAGTTRS